jgi:hypothetical protein
MTRRHFVMLAQFQKAERHLFRNHVQYVQHCERLADVLIGYNPNFNRRTFLEACGATLGDDS